jgi:hypothetical protein
MSRSRAVGWVGRSLITLTLAASVLLALAAPAGPQLPEGPASTPALEDLPSLRSEYTRVTRNSDGTLTAEISTRPLHYEKPDGSWAPVDSVLRATSVDGYAWRSTSGPLHLKFGRVAGEQLARRSQHMD